MRIAKHDDGVNLVENLGKVLKRFMLKFKLLYLEVVLACTNDCEIISNLF